jgi:Glycosyltransferase family 87
MHLSSASDSRSRDLLIPVVIAVLMALSLAAIAAPGLGALLAWWAGKGEISTLGAVYGLDAATEALSPARRVTLVALLGGGLLGLCVGCLWCAARASRGLIGAREIWVGAVLLGVGALLLPPGLSDDTLTYTARGEMIVGLGVNPYHFAPNKMDDWETNPLLARDVWAGMTSAYGFAWAWVMAAVRWLAGPSLAMNVILYKGIGLAGHLVLLLCLWHLWPREDPRGRVVTLALVGLHPAAVIETAGMGHTEGLMMALWVGGALLAVRGRALPAGLLIGLAGGVKWVPLLGAPLMGLLLIRQERGVRRFSLFSLGVLVALILPTLLFEPLRQITWSGLRAQSHYVSGGSPALMLALDLEWLFGVDNALGMGMAITRWVGFGLIALVCGLALRSRDPEGLWAGLMAIALIAALLLSAYFHPWDTLWILPWAVLARRRMPVLAAAAIALSLAAVFQPLVPIATQSYQVSSQLLMFLVWGTPTALVFALWALKRAAFRGSWTQ